MKKNINYKETVILPKTEFSMKAGLNTLEPKLLERWDRNKVYENLRQASKGKEKFILHDGPPYANGHLHIGHALNKILKDVIVRTFQMLGFDSNYVPGWDCHGLPIEWKIEEGFRKKGIDKDEIPLIEFRNKCREFASKWIEVQKEEFKRLGVVGDWDNPYTTMSGIAEATIVREIGKFILNGGLYKGSKPVLWSVVEKTALADAEVEYDNHESTTVWVKFPIKKSQKITNQNCSILIWTTTPWTLPGNRAIAFGNDIDYSLIKVTDVSDESLISKNEHLVVAQDLLEKTLDKGKVTNFDLIDSFKGHQLKGTVCRHCFDEDGYDFEVPLHSGDFVNIEQGTGFVHIAPGHGEDDFALCKEVQIEVPDTVNGSGVYYETIPVFSGQHIFKVDESILALLKSRNRLFAQGKLVHSYPHSWRSKAPLIYRNTPQWFISMNKLGLREKALEGIQETKWFPQQGSNRIHAMVEARPDWCISRQRHWGVPIPVFINIKTGEALRDAEVIENIAKKFEQYGSDIWFEKGPDFFLTEKYNADEWEQIKDIIEVWFDSGSTHAFVLEEREDLSWPADLYLEGSDQHRGWFHTSLLESCGTRGIPPYKSVLTHGFVLDEKNRKMSKSAGNVVSPQDISKQNGVDILRLWVVSSDYSQDLTIGPNILKQNSDLYRRIRNTFRYLLGNLNNFDEKERVGYSKLPELERLMLHKLWEIDSHIRRLSKDYDFNGIFTLLHNFCSNDLSAFYFDIRKDTLYCNGLDDLTRMSSRTILDYIFNHLVRWLAPYVCFTAEEAWLSRYPSEDDSIHYKQFLAVSDTWRDDELNNKWENIKVIRRFVTTAIEKKRAEKIIGSSLEAHPFVSVSDKLMSDCKNVDMAEICITSFFTLESSLSKEEGDDIDVNVNLAMGQKCERCWKIVEEKMFNSEASLCKRCYDTIN